MKMFVVWPVVVLAVIAGVIPRLWLRVVAAALFVLVGLSFLRAAYDWQRRIAAGTAGKRGIDPPLTPGLSIVAAIVFLALGALFTLLAVRAHSKLVQRRAVPGPPSLDEASNTLE
jgi:tellurite resistance protein TehA-like permease